MLKSISKLLSGSSTLALGTLILTTASPQQASASTAMIFCGGNEATPTGLTTTQINGFRLSGFQTMILFNITVQANGDFTYAGYTLCSNGSYVGPGNYASLLNQCKAAPSSINRIEACIGGWGDPSFTNIKNIIAAQGNNTGNVIYRNLGALHGNLPIDAIDYDDESTYDSGSAITFGGMAGSLGMKVTLCPYTNPGYWQAVKSGLGGYCDAVYLQCYDGGAGNDPATWNGYFGGFKVIPGYWDWERDMTFFNKMQQWGPVSAGGFLWPSDGGGNPPAGPGEMVQYADWIHQCMDANIGGSGGTYGLQARHSGKYLDAYYARTTNGTLLAQSTWNGGSNLKWIANSVGFCQYVFMGVQSGRCACVPNSSLSDGMQLDIWDYVGAASQKWTVTATDGGYYKVINVNSGKAMNVRNSSTAEGAPVEQYTWNETAAQQWAFVDQDITSGTTYAIQARHSGKCLDAYYALTDNGTLLAQSTYNGGANVKWVAHSVGGNQYNFTGVQSGRNVDVPGSTGNVIQLQIYDPNTTAAQKWACTPTDSGYYTVMNVGSGKVWDVHGASTAEGAPVYQDFAVAGAPNQQWMFLPK